MNSIIKLAILAGISATAYSSYQGTVLSVIPALQGAINHQEETVQVAEAMESSAAPAAREQWETRKASAQFQLDALRAWAESATPADLTNAEPVTLQVTEGTNVTTYTVTPETIPQ